MMPRIAAALLLLTACAGELPPDDASDAGACPEADAGRPACTKRIYDGCDMPSWPAWSGGASGPWFCVNTEDDAGSPTLVVERCMGVDFCVHEVDVPRESGTWRPWHSDKDPCPTWLWQRRNPDNDRWPFNL